jgi:hypothetical protein
MTTIARFPEIFVRRAASNPKFCTRYTPVENVHCGARPIVGSAVVELSCAAGTMRRTAYVTDTGEFVYPG